MELVIKWGEAIPPKTQALLCVDVLGAVAEEKKRTFLHVLVVSSLPRDNCRSSSKFSPMDTRFFFHFEGSSDRLPTDFIELISA